MQVDSSELIWFIMQMLVAGVVLAGGFLVLRKIFSTKLPDDDDHEV